MACETTKYVGRDVVLEYVIGCGDALPAEGDWKKFGSLRTKEFNLAWDTTDATDSDSIGALRENLATFQSLTISGEGLCKASGAGAANLIELTKHVAQPTTTGGQPVVWLRMTFPDLTFTAFMLLANMSRSAPYDDMVTYTMEASATASDFGLIVTVTPADVASVTVTPNPGTIDTDAGTLQMSALALPANAPQGVTWTTTTPAIASVDANGLVTALTDGAATIVATSVDDPLITGTAIVNITNQV